jgi:hypothetical protein
MFNNLTALGMGIVIFAIVIGVGSVVLEKFGTANAGCPTGYTYQANSSGTTYTTGYCCLNTGVDCSSAGNYTTASAGTQATYYLGGQMGTSGLAGWTPAIIALSVGLLFIGALMMKKGMKY